jgi:hypothetical protein
MNNENEKAHLHFLGYEDKFIDVMNTTNYTGEFVETRRKTINNTAFFVFSTKSDTESYYGYKNMKFLGDLSNIDSITLLFGGQQLDKIYPSINEEHRSFLILDRNIIPAIDNNFTILIKYDKIKYSTFEIVYDVYAITDNMKQLDHHVVLHLNQFCGTERSDKNTEIYTDMPYYNPIKRIVVYSKYPLTNVKLNIENKYYFGFKDTGNNKYVCELDKTINFTRITKSGLQSICASATREEPNIISIFGESLMPTKINVTNNVFDCMFFNTKFSFPEYYPELYKRFSQDTV